MFILLKFILGQSNINDPRESGIGFESNRGVWEVRTASIRRASPRRPRRVSMKRESYLLLLHVRMQSPHASFTRRKFQLIWAYGDPNHKNMVAKTRLRPHLGGHGSMDPRIRESMDSWIHVSMDPRSIWIHRSMHPRMHGSMDPRRTSNGPPSNVCRTSVGPPSDVCQTSDRRPSDVDPGTLCRRCPCCTL